MPLFLVLDLCLIVIDSVNKRAGARTHDGMRYRKSVSTQNGRCNETHVCTAKHTDTFTRPSKGINTNSLSHTSHLTSHTCTLHFALLCTLHSPTRSLESVKSSS
ncbi:hypothetical protein DFP73DRAFT_25026 [Morchella snyderi]|nr:hypothetical protein DFP73DRAFT_25026 [Morchella snyderi]